MAGKFSQIEAQVQTQAQTLTPQQLLVSQLTEMPVEALYERVDQELKENIALERDTDHGDEGEEASSTEQQDYAETSEATDYSDYADLSGLSDDVAPSHGADKDIPETVVGETLSFYDQLEEQIGFFHLDDHEQELIRYLIGSLDDDGLLHTSLRSWNRCFPSCSNSTLQASAPAHYRNACYCRCAAHRTTTHPSSRNWSACSQTTSTA